MGSTPINATNNHKFNSISVHVVIGILCRLWHKIEYIVLFIIVCENGNNIINTIKLIC